jgi:cell envelope opacity-associated protein A
MMPDYQKMLNQQPFDTGGLDTSRYGNRVDTNQVAIPAYQDQAVDWQSMLTPEEMSEMNSVQSDLGTMNPTDYNTVWKDYNAPNNSIASQIAAWKAKQPAPVAPVQPAKPVYAGRGQTR